MLRFVIFTFSVMLAATAFTSCSKKKCEGVNCFNGGSCTDGKCNCPAGYKGDFCLVPDTTEIDFYNNTFTPVNISINYQGQVIPVGGYVAYTGPNGYGAKGSANTSEHNSSGAQVGLQLSWTLNDSFPATKRAVYINVPSQYFFLKITNTSSYTINEVFVNYGLASQTLDYLAVPDDGNTYDIGYYDAFTNSNLYLTASNYSWTYNLNLPFTQNQAYNFVASN